MVQNAPAVLALPPKPRRRARPARVVRSGLYHLLVLAVCLITFFPIYWMVLTSIQPSKLSTVYPPSFWPQAIDLSAFRKLFEDVPIGRWILNSTLLAGMATLLCVALAVFGAYALSSVRWRGRAAFAKIGRAHV